MMDEFDCIRGCEFLCGIVYIIRDTVPRECGRIRIKVIKLHRFN